MNNVKVSGQNSSQGIKNLTGVALTLDRMRLNETLKIHAPSYNVSTLFNRTFVNTTREAKPLIRLDNSDSMWPLLLKKDSQFFKETTFGS
jgi:hypothetical protein